MNVPGGVPRRELTLSACQGACEQTLYCVGVDIDPDPESSYCWLTVPPDAGGPIQAFVGVTHYVLTRNEGCPYAGEAVLISGVARNFIWGAGINWAHSMGP